jgi:hypothetical protein
VPLKIESGVVPPGAGAGAGQVSPVPVLVGRNVPLVNRAAGMIVAAASSRVRVMPVTSSPPPTSDMMMAFCPAGPTSRMSMSAGKVWVRLFRLIVTFVTVPVNPATGIFEG